MLSCGWLIYVHTPEMTAEQLALLRLKFVPQMRHLLRPELREWTTFIGLTLLSVPVCVAVIYIGSALGKRKNRLKTSSAATGAIILSSFGLALLGLGFYQPLTDPQFMYILFDPVWDHHFLLAAVSIATVFAVPALLKFNFKRWNRSIFIPLLLFIPLVQTLSCRIYTLRLISNSVPFHPNIIAYAISQAVAGNTDYHQYGFYPRFLAPFFRINPPNMLNISVVMAVLFLAGCLTVYWVLSENVKNQVLVPAFAVIFFLTTGMWSFFDPARPQLSIDPYFAYYPIRFLFPALGVLFFYILVRGRKKSAVFLCGLLAGTSLWWNFSSGVAVAGAFAAVMFLELVFSRERSAALSRAGSFLLGALLAFGALLVMFSVQQGEIISPGKSFKYLKLFSNSGYMMLPLPAVPAPWCVFIGLYLLGILIGLREFISGRFSVFAKMSLFLSVLGVGLFTYYQGRSHLYNLPAVIWPALILMFMFTDRLIRLIRTGLINRYFKLLLLPTVFVTLSAVVTIIWHGKMLAWGVERTWQYVTSTDNSGPLEQNVRFILANAGENKVVNIVSDMQGVYYAETGLRAGIPNFGMVEIFFIEDWIRIAEELELAKVPLFIARRRVAPPLYEYYTLKAVSKDGSLFYFIPRQYPPDCKTAPGKVRRSNR